MMEKYRNTNKEELRFNNILGEEYELFRQAVYYYDDLEKMVGTQVYKLSPNPNGIYLDVGIGSGITTYHTLQLNPDIQVVGVDSEEKMLRQAEELLKEKMEGITLVKNDILQYLSTVPDKHFDGVYSAWTIHNLQPETREKLLKELSRVTKQGGIYVNGDKLALDDEIAHQQSYNSFIKLLSRISESGRKDLEEEWVKHYQEDELIKFTEIKQQSLLESNGYHEVKYVFRELLDAVVVARKH